MLILIESHQDCCWFFFRKQDYIRHSYFPRDTALAQEFFW